MFDNFNRNPKAQRLVNEAVDNVLEKMDIQTKTVEGKSIQIITRGLGTGKEKPVQLQLPTMGALIELDWNGYLVAAMERKLSSQGAKSVQKDADLQFVVNINQAGLQRDIFYVPFGCFFMVNFYEERSYWAVLDVTLDVKTGDGTRILQTQQLESESSRFLITHFFKMWNPMLEGF